VFLFVFANTISRQFCKNVVAWLIEQWTGWRHHKRTQLKLWILPWALDGLLRPWLQVAANLDFRNKQTVSKHFLWTGIQKIPVV